jgi:hypothetical protein
VKKLFRANIVDVHQGVWVHQQEVAAGEPKGGLLGEAAELLLHRQHLRLQQLQHRKCRLQSRLRPSQVKQKQAENQFCVQNSDILNTSFTRVKKNGNDAEKS